MFEVNNTIILPVRLESDGKQWKYNLEAMQCPCCEVIFAMASEVIDSDNYKCFIHCPACCEELLIMDEADDLVDTLWIPSEGKCNN